MYQARLQSSEPMEITFEGDLEGWVNDTYFPLFFISIFENQYSFNVFYVSASPSV